MSIKKELYSFIDKVRDELIIDSVDYKKDINVLFLMQNNIVYKFEELKTEGLRGILSKTKKINSIILNSKYPFNQSRFTLLHEIMHVLLHKDKVFTSFHYEFKDFNPNVDFIEWEANEGAAELLMPFREIVPDLFESFATTKNLNQTIKVLADKYQLLPLHIRYRLESLKSSIWNYGVHNKLVIPLSTGESGNLAEYTVEELISLSRQINSRIR